MQNTVRFNPRLALAGLAMLVVLPGAMCSTSDPATMDRLELTKFVVENGAMEAFKGPGTGSIISGLAAMPETAKGLLIADLKSERDRLEQEAFIAQGAEAKRLDARADWVQANLDCIASGGKNCSQLQKLTAERKADDMKANEGDGGGGHSH